VIQNPVPSLDSWRAALQDAMAAASPPGQGSAGGEYLRRGRFNAGLTSQCHRAFRTLVHRAEHVAVIAVTSPQRRDGRSTVAAGLALGIAAATEERVLLLDLDFACPAQGQIFGVRSTPGLSDCMLGNMPLRGLADAEGQVWLLPAGTRSSETVRLFDTMASGELLRACRERFRWIVADLPPLLESAQAGSWCDAADASLLVGRYRGTALGALERAARLLQSGRPTGFLMTSDSGLPQGVRRLL
jgi:Mrp family chromosome partitioning ATPase